MLEVFNKNLFDDLHARMLGHANLRQAMASKCCLFMQNGACLSIRLSHPSMWFAHPDKQIFTMQNGAYSSENANLRQAMALKRHSS